jgi:uncharacterized repeat protein (TIGR01451 family)
MIPIKVFRQFNMLLFWGGLVLLMPFTSTAQKPFICGNQFFITLSSMPPSLNEVVIDPQTGSAVFKIVNGDIIVSVNAAGYRFTDNFIYCLDPDKQQLIRLDANGTATILATLPLNPMLSYFAGDITPDGRYLVLIGTELLSNGLGIASEIVRVDLTSPTYQLTTLKINVSAQIFDIAFHPITDVLYGYDSFTQRLVEIDPFSGSITFPFPTSGVPIVSGSLFFDAYGNLYAYGSPNFMSEQNTLYRLNPTTGASTFLTRGQNATSSDGCSCPYTIELSKSVSPKSTLPCSDIEYTFEFVNTSRVTQKNLKFKDNLPPGFSFVSVQQNQIGGRVLSQSGDLSFSMDSITLPIGTSKLIIVVNTGSVKAGVYKNQAVLTNLPAGLGSKIVSDNLETLVKNDSTVVTVIGFPFDTIRATQTICEGTPFIRLDAAQYVKNVPGQITYQWQDSTSLSYLDVKGPGQYAAKLSSGCDSAIVLFDVVESSLFVSVVKDAFNINLGDSLQMEAIPVNAGNTTILQWLDPQGSSVTCPSCAKTYARPFNDIRYTILATNELGCQDSAFVTVKVKKNRAIFFPNVFNPENSKQEGNGYFYASGDQFTKVDKLSVYSRWGEKLFETSNIALNDPYVGWDGLIRGQSAMPGVYVWVAQISFLDGLKETYQGDVTVVR